MERIGFILTMLLITAAPITQQQSNCPNMEDYSPCKCVGSSTNLTLDCDRVSMDNVAKVFSRTSTTSLDLTLTLTPLPSDNIIPNNLLDDKKVRHIQLGCPSMSYKMNINPNAFRSSKHYTISFLIKKCDLFSIKYEFLREFENLVQLSIISSTNIDRTVWDTLPSLPSLTSLYLNSVQGLNRWTRFPSLVRGLERFSMTNNSMDPVGDQALNRILDWLGNKSLETLQSLDLSRNAPTRIPTQFSKFKNLANVSLDNPVNRIEIINAGCLSSYHNVSYLGLAGSLVNTIEPDTFKGDFRNAKVNLTRSNLTRFEAVVFQDMLEQMITSSGFLLIKNGNFDCVTDPCHFAWLIRDRRELLSVVIEGACSNGTAFNDLLPSGLDSCYTATTTFSPISTTTIPSTTLSPESSTARSSSTSTAKTTTTPNRLPLNPSTTTKTTITPSSSTTISSTLSFSEVIKTSIPNTNPTSTQQSTTIISTEGPYAIDCSSLPDGSYPSGPCSSHFYMCSNGMVYEFACPEGLVFYGAKSRCDWPSSVPECKSKR